MTMRGVRIGFLMMALVACGPGPEEVAHSTTQLPSDEGWELLSTGTREGPITLDLDPRSAVDVFQTVLLEAPAHGSYQLDGTFGLRVGADETHLFAVPYSQVPGVQCTVEMNERAFTSASCADGSAPSSTISGHICGPAHFAQGSNVLQIHCRVNGGFSYAVLTMGMARLVLVQNGRRTSVTIDPVLLYQSGASTTLPHGLHVFYFTHTQ